MEQDTIVKFLEGEDEKPEANVVKKGSGERVRRNWKNLNKRMI